jgi:hypothetical protein
MLDPGLGPARTGYQQGMITIGLVLLLIGAIAAIPILWSLGVILVVVGAVMLLLGRSGHQVGGRAHYW